MVGETSRQVIVRRPEIPLLSKHFEPRPRAVDAKTDKQERHRRKSSGVYRCKRPPARPHHCTDPIVRVEAGRLRDRLSSYYEGEGLADRMLISIPKGGYVPEFSERHPLTPSKRIDWPAACTSKGTWCGLIPSCSQAADHTITSNQLRPGSLDPAFVALH